MDLLGKYHERALEKPPQKVGYETASIDMNSAGVVTKLLVKLSGGAIKSERQVNIIMITLIALFIGISIYMMFGGSGVSVVVPAKLPTTQRGF